MSYKYYLCRFCSDCSTPPPAPPSLSLPLSLYLPLSPYLPIYLPISLVPLLFSTIFRYLFIIVSSFFNLRFSHTCRSPISFVSYFCLPYHLLLFIFIPSLSLFMCNFPSIASATSFQDSIPFFPLCSSFICLFYNSLLF